MTQCLSWSSQETAGHMNLSSLSSLLKDSARAPDSFRCISWLSVYQAELFKLDLSYESPRSLLKMWILIQWVWDGPAFLSFLNSIYIYFIFNWRINCLKCYDGFCHTRRWISPKYTCAPSLWDLPPTPHAFPPSRLSQSARLGVLCYTATSHSLFYMWSYIFFHCFSLTSSYPLLPQLCPQVCSLCELSIFLIKFQIQLMLLVAHPFLSSSVIGNLLHISP